MGWLDGNINPRIDGWSVKGWWNVGETFATKFISFWVSKTVLSVYTLRGCSSVHCEWLKRTLKRSKQVTSIRLGLPYLKGGGGHFIDGFKSFFHLKRTRGRFLCQSSSQSFALLQELILFPNSFFRQRVTIAESIKSWLKTFDLVLSKLALEIGTKHFSITKTVCTSSHSSLLHLEHQNQIDFIYRLTSWFDFSFTAHAQYQHDAASFMRTSTFSFCAAAPLTYTRCAISYRR